jgi:hypothetical protein
MIKQIENFFAYIHNRWVDPCHRVEIRHPDCPKGKYFEPDVTLLYVNFQILVDYVELECGSIWPAVHFESRWQRCHRTIKDLPVLHWFVRPVRNARRGLHYLRWEMKIKDCPQQAVYAREMFRLYKWWKHTRTRREDPYTRFTALGHNWETPLTAKERKILLRCEKLSSRYTQEDTRNLHALIDIRGGLWS